MAKDDYFVIVYQLLKYLYERVKNGEYPEEEKLNSRYFNIPVNYWGYILESLIEEGYIKGIKSFPTKDGIVFTDLRGMQITPRGIEYLFENSFLEKVKRTLKDIKDLTPFI